MVTPGSTAPDASFTEPAIVPRVWARPAAATNITIRAASRIRVGCRMDRSLCDRRTLRTACQELCSVTRNANASFVHDQGRNCGRVRAFEAFLTCGTSRWIPALRIRLLPELAGTDPRLYQILRIFEKARNRQVLRPVVICQMSDVLGQRRAGAVRNAVLP